ncbi:Protein madd-4, partial [Gonioctena quinquepunctata]
VPFSIDTSEELLPGLYHTQSLFQPYPPPPMPERLIGEQVVPSESTFIPDEWGHCSVTCGEGVRKREVHCKIFLEFSRTIAKLPDKQCTGPKPIEIESCHMEPCSSERIGVDIKDDPYSSRSDIRVAPGSPGKSYSWREQGFTHCSATCLGGIQELIVNCVRDDTQKVTSPYMCPIELKPEIRIQTCNDHPCPPRWNYSEFSACSQSCGIGIQTREVNCIHEVTQGGGNTVIVPNNMCPQPPPPDRQYCNVLDCPVRWHLHEWSRCSKSCGGGTKTRRVECKQVMAQNHTVDRIPTMCPSPKPSESKPCNTKSCVVESDKPHIDVSNSTFIQHDSKKKKISLKVGGAATVFLGTTIKIKCPVKRFNRTKIQWMKEKNFLPKTKKFKTSKKGALRVSNLSLRDSGVYTLVNFPTSEEIQKHGYKTDKIDLISDINSNRDGEPIYSDDHSHEQRPERGRKRPTSRPKLFTPTLPSLRLDSSYKDDKFQSTLDQNNVQLWPFQTFSNSRGHRMIDFPSDHQSQEVFFANPPADEVDIPENSTDSSEEDHIVVLGKGKKENLVFEWKTGSWSKCSETCGGAGLQMRKMHCIVRLFNASQPVDDILCSDAGLETPKAKRKCGFDQCPEWTSHEWSPCEESKCFAWHKALQRRIVRCEIGGNLTLDPSKCDFQQKPVDRQECRSERCIGKWKVGRWSECDTTCEKRGLKYRIIQCVWYGTKKAAGSACKDIPRPPVTKECVGPSCTEIETICMDHSMFCPNVKAMNMCRIMRYQQQCCQTCKD